MHAPQPKSDEKVMFLLGAVAVVVYRNLPFTNETRAMTSTKDTSFDI
jgi:hypothetical protein